MNVLKSVILSFAAAAASSLCAGEITLLAPRSGATVTQLNTAQKAFLAMPRAERMQKFADASYRETLAKEGGYRPVPVTFSWKSDLPAGSAYMVQVSESADFAAPITVTTKKEHAQLDNFKIARKYYWKVLSVQGEKTISSPVFTFTTEDLAPRLLRVDYVANVRDLGGRRAMDGKRVRQGIVIRSAGLNGNAQYLRASSQEELFQKLPQLRLPVMVAEETLRNLEAAQKNPAAAVRVPWLLTPSWSVYFPMLTLNQEMISGLSALTRLPKVWKGCTARTVTMSHGKIAFPDHKEGKIAVLMQEFESPADGVMQIGAGADWFWMLWINGKMVHESLSGNGKTPASDNFCLNIPVRKGKNLLVVYLASGSGGWEWHCAERKTADIPQHYAKLIKDEKSHLDAMMQTPISKDRVVPGKAILPPEMKQMLVKEWGIRTDLDLRSDGECFGMKGSPLGDEVRWVQISSAMYAGLGSDEGRKAFREVFKIFLDRANYPLIFHCIGGQDRTGAVAFILNGLLGVSEEELYKDWECSGFMNRNVYFCHEKCFNHLIEVFDKYPGKNIHEKIENYVLSLGFTRSDIELFRAIMLE